MKRWISGLVLASLVVLVSTNNRVKTPQADALVNSDKPVQTNLLARNDLPAPTNQLAQEKLPQVVSINLCTDQLVMLLAEPEQILALSTLSQEQAGSYFHQQADNFPTVEPIAEQVLPLAPDVVVAGPHTSRYTINLLDELGLQFESMPIASNVDEMLANVERMGELLSQQQKATAIINDVNTRLASIAERVRLLDTNNKPTIAVYDPNGYTVGDNTVRGEMIRLAGWQNVATTKGIDTYGVLDLEQLISLRPQALVESPYSEDTYSRGQMLTQHPAIRASGLNPQIIKVPSNQTICSGPWVVDVIQNLFSVNTALSPTS